MNRKLDAFKVQDIRRRIAAGTSIGKLAKEFGVTYQAVWNLKKGVTWGAERSTPGRKDYVPTVGLSRLISSARREKIYARKKEAGLSNAALAKEFGVSATTMARAMREAKVVEAHIVGDLAKSRGFPFASQTLQMGWGEIERLEREQSKMPLNTRRLLSEVEAGLSYWLACRSSTLES